MFKPKYGKSAGNCNMCGNPYKLTGWPVSGKLKHFDFKTLLPLVYPATLVYCCNGLDESEKGYFHTPNFGHRSDYSNRLVVADSPEDLKAKIVVFEQGLRKES